METLNVKVDEDYLRKLGSCYNPRNQEHFSESINFGRNIRNQAFEGGKVLQMEYGWSSYIEIEVLERNSLLFIEDCISLASDDCFEEWGVDNLKTFTRPLRRASVHKYKDEHIDVLLEDVGVEKRQEMTGTIKQIHRNTPSDISCNDILEILYEAAIESISHHGSPFTWDIVREFVEPVFEEHEEINPQENEFFKGNGGSIFNTTQSTDMMEVVAQVRQGFYNNPIVTLPKFPSEKDKINTRYMGFVEKLREEKYQ